MEQANNPFIFPIFLLPWYWLPKSPCDATPTVSVLRRVSRFRVRDDFEGMSS